jgi:hypothetical protein
MGVLSCAAISHAGSFVVVKTFVKSLFEAMKRNDLHCH